ncbi:L,D-transpeptidase family protein [Engelhardtia mirabilis]
MRAREGAAPRLDQVESSPFSRASVEAAEAASREVEVAAALAHGADQRALQLASSQLDAASANAVRAFTEALGGERAAAEQRALAIAESGAVPSRMKQLVAASLGAVAFPLPDAADVSPLERAMDMRLHAAAAEHALDAGRYGEASVLIGRVLQMELDAEWDPSVQSLTEWSNTLHAAERRHRWDPQGDWESIDVQVRQGDSLVAIRKRVLADHPDLHLSTGLIARSNGMEFDDYLREGQTLRIPVEPVSVLVDVGARWMLYFIGNEVVESFHVGVGREGAETILGTFEAGQKIPEPPWWRRGQEPVPYGDPKNPLGTRWIGWRVPGEADDTSYGFHGTWEPQSIGTASSEGCVRMVNDRVELLFEILPMGAEILVRP